ncbi:MAG: hypothetical protein Q4C71_05670 [Microbacteriaceae bacterium]|nr:hypothetical protein [Microbacteriaceae bacterium]
MSYQPIYQRLVRRETHSSRSFVTSLVALLAIVAALYLATEVVLSLLGKKPLLVSPADIIGFIFAPHHADYTLAVTVGAVAALLGLLLVVLALKGGRRGRHYRIDERSAVIIDDHVIAGSESITVQRAAGVPHEQVRVSVGKSGVYAEITPISGIDLESNSAQQALQEELESLRLQPTLRAKAYVSKKGRL